MTYGYQPLKVSLKAQTQKSMPFCKKKMPIFVLCFLNICMWPQDIFPNFSQVMQFTLQLWAFLLTLHVHVVFATVNWEIFAPRKFLHFKFLCVQFLLPGNMPEFFRCVHMYMYNYNLDLGYMNFQDYGVLEVTAIFT